MSISKSAATSTSKPVAKPVTTFDGASGGGGGSEPANSIQDRSGSALVDRSGDYIVSRS